MPPGDSPLLPNPPPPRPAQRDAAIEAALRRFDGEPAPAPARRTSWTRHPQLGLALAASLVLLISIPAAVIVLRDQPPSPAGVSGAPRSALPRAVPPSSGADQMVGNAVTAETPEPPKPVDELARVPSVAPSVRAEEKEAVAAEPNDVTNALPAPAPPMAAAAPPPPPPAVAQKSAEDAAGSDLVVTGSRVRQPESTTSGLANREQKQRSAARAESDAATAPDWVLKDRAYATFLTNLQSAVRANDRGAVTRLIAFPLRVNSGRNSQLYRDAPSVRADYDAIFTAKVRRAIIDQRFDRLFGRDQGVMIGDGEVWFDHECVNPACSPPGPVKIQAINR